MNKFRLTVLCALVYVSSLGAQDQSSPTISPWQERFYQARSETARSFVFQAAARKGDPKALQFLEDWAKRAANRSEGFVALKALGTIPTYPFPALIMKTMGATPDLGAKARILTLLTHEGPHLSAGYGLLLGELAKHRHDSFGQMILQVVSRFLQSPPPGGNTELKDLLLTIFEEPEPGPLHQSVYALSRNLDWQTMQNIDISALLQVDPEFALPATTNLLADHVDGVEDLLIAIFLDDSAGFFRAKLDTLLGKHENLLLRLRFLDQADSMSWQQLDYLRATTSVADDPRVRNFLISSLNSQSEKKQILALWMIRDRHRKSAEKILRHLLTQELNDSVAMLANDTLTLITGNPAYFNQVKRKLAEGDLDLQLQRLELAERIHLNGRYIRSWLSTKLKATHGNWKIQGHLIRLAGSMQLPETISICEDALKHKRWQVRLAGIEALVKLGTRPALSRLAALTRDPQQRLARTASDGLRRLTGMNLGANPDGWRRLIGTLGKNWKPRRTPLRDVKLSDETRYGPQFYGLDIRSNRVIFVCDVSGSMLGRKIEDLKRELWRAMRSIDAPQSAFNAIFFASNVDAVWKRLAHVRKNTRAKVKKAIGKIQANGGTNVWGALQRAFLDQAADTIVILTDGQPSVGKVTAPDEILAAVAKLNRFKRLQIHAVYLPEDSVSLMTNVISSQAASNFMKRLAQIGGGQYVEPR